MKFFSKMAMAWSVSWGMLGYARASNGASKAREAALAGGGEEAWSLASIGFAKAADSLDRLGPVFGEMFSGLSETRAKDSAETLAKVEKLADSARRMHSESDSEDFKRSLNRQLESLSGLAKEVGADSQSAAQREESFLVALSSGVMATRAAAAYFSGSDTAAAIAFGEEAVRLAEASASLSAPPSEPDGLEKLRSGWMAMGHAAGACSARLRVSAEGLSGEAAEGLASRALGCAREAVRCVRRGGGGDAAAAKAFVAGHAEVARLLFDAGEPERAGHWVAECFAADREAAGSEFGLSAAPDPRSSEEFRGFAGRFAPAKAVSPARSGAGL